MDFVLRNFLISYIKLGLRISFQFFFFFSYLFNCMYVLACIDLYFLSSLYVLCIIKKE